jgi:hypothetical protein
VADDIAERLARVEASGDERDRRYMERFVAQERATGAALDAAQRAVEKAEVASEKRFEAVNEFRATLQDQTNTFITRNEINPVIKALEDKLDLLENWRSKATGVGIILVVFAGVVGAAVVKAFGG